VSITHKSTPAKVTAELHIHLDDDESFTNAEIAKPLITENNTKRWKRWCNYHKTWPSDDWKYVIWTDESSFTLFPPSGWVYVWTSPKEACNPECLVPTVKHGARSVMMWAAISSILLVLYLL